MLGTERKKIILEKTSKDGFISIDFLSEHLKVSRMTIWRDLKALSDEGKIIKVHGGAMKIEESSEKEHSKVESSYISINQQLIAHFTAETIVKKDQIIFLDSKNTIIEMIPHLKQPNLTILTNGLTTITHAAQYTPHFNLISCGGIFQDQTNSFVGPQAIKFFKQYKADIFFFSASGLSIEDGITDINPLDIDLKKIMGEQAKMKVGLFDSSKIGKVSLSKIWDLSEIDLLILDEGADEYFLKKLKDSGVNYQIASKTWLKNTIKKKKGK